MFNKCVFYSLIMLLAACGSSGGSSAINSSQSFYIDANAGSDTNDGSQDFPWQTISKINSSSFTKQTTVYLKRGQSWHEQLILPSSDMTIDAYGSGSVPRLNGSFTISNWLDEGAGIYSNVVSLKEAEALGNLSENGAMMFFIPWNTDVATTFSSAVNGSYSFQFLTNTLYIKPVVTPSTNVYLASLLLRGVYALNKSNIIIQNLDISRYSLQGVEFHDCVNCSVNNIRVSRIGGAVIAGNVAAPPDFLYAGNGIDFSNSCSAGNVSNVSVSEIFDSCFAVEVYLSNNHASSIEFADSQLDRCGFAGVEISLLSNLGVNTNSTIDGVTVLSVDVNQAGKGWSGRRYGIDGHGMRIIADNGVGSMSDVSVKSSQVKDSAGEGIKLAGEIGVVKLHQLELVSNDGSGITFSDPLASSLRLDLSSSIIHKNLANGLSYNAPFAAGMHIYQNTFYDNAVINLSIFNQGSDMDIRNNLFFSSSPMTHIFIDALLVNAIINNNCYNDTTNMFGYNSVAYSDLASFNAASSFDANGVGDGIVGLVDPLNGDFSLQSISSCRGLGDVNTGVTIDYAGKLYVSPPSSGAHEF